MPASENPGLDEVLHNEVLLASFQKFSTEKIFDPKPVPFLLAVEEFQKAALNPKISAEHLSGMASKIATDYVRPEGFVQKGAGIGEVDGVDFINIPFSMSHGTNANVEKLGQIAKGELPMPSREEIAATFEQAREEVFNTVKDKGNNLDNWKNSPAFKQAMQTVREVESAENRIKQLESRAEKLQTNKWERFKAFFSGGADKQIEKIAAEIDKNKMEILLKTDPQKFETLQREKQKMAQKMGQKQDKLAPGELELQQMKSAAVNLALDNQFGGLKPGQRQEMETVLDKGTTKLKASENFGQQKEELQKSVKVGDMLKGQLGNKESPGQNKLKVK